MLAPPPGTRVHSGNIIPPRYCTTVLGDVVVWDVAPVHVFGDDKRVVDQVLAVKRCAYVFRIPLINGFLAVGVIALHVAGVDVVADGARNIVHKLSTIVVFVLVLSVAPVGGVDVLHGVVTKPSLQPSAAGELRLVFSQVFALHGGFPREVPVKHYAVDVPGVLLCKPGALGPEQRVHKPVGRIDVEGSVGNVVQAPFGHAVLTHRSGCANERHG